MRRDELRRKAEGRGRKAKAEGGVRRAESRKQWLVPDSNFWPSALSPQPSACRRRRQRRGVLLIVVLSMLVLFMLIGTAFLMTSSQSRESAKSSAKFNRLGTEATSLLDDALMTVLRDTENPNSTVFTHSLLRDLYGTDGFQGVIYQPPAAQLVYMPRYATADSTMPLGPTQGQFIDIYVRSLAFNADDPLTPIIETTPPGLPAPDLRHVIKLDRNVLGQAQLHPLPLTRGYYNGCLLTVTSGPAAGQSARIVDYEFIASINPSLTNPVRNTNVFRFRVMAFGRKDGQSLVVDQTAARSPELTDLAGASFIVNGRPFNGTGVGYNPLAANGQARLTALEVNPIAGVYIGTEASLTPNARYLKLGNIGSYGLAFLAFNRLDDDGDSLVDEIDEGNPFLIGGTAADFMPLNTGMTTNYPSVVGVGDADESYDAADFQNMWLALLTVTPRSQGRVVQPDDTDNPADADALPDVLAVDDPDVDPTQFLRLDLEDLPLPSFHRPDLVNFWYHRLHKLLVDGGMDKDTAVRAVLDPYDDNWQPQFGLGPEQAALIASIKRKIMMRPIAEDHPKFDGNNTQSIPPNPAATDLAIERDLNGDNQPDEYQISFPFWEAVGPWDVDNDNDGVPDSNWIDLGDPVIQLEDGTRVKTMYAYFIVDMDSRLNVNAHGLADHVFASNLAVSYDATSGAAQTGPAAKNLAAGANSNVLAQGGGYGPAEISLRPVFPAPTRPTNVGNRVENRPPREMDDYATLLAGRTVMDGTSVAGTVRGRFGYAEPIMLANEAVTPGTNYTFDTTPPVSPFTGEKAAPDLAAQLKFFDYPWSLWQRSAFGTPPDLKARYALGLDYSGQPYYEVLNDSNPANNMLPAALLTDSPYELDLSSPQRREGWDSKSDFRFADAPEEFLASLTQNDDAPFSTADMERVLRAWDAETGSLPSRLWDVVNAFDPIKLADFDFNRVADLANYYFDSTAEPELLAAAQLQASINRRLVTSDSYDLPVPGGSVPNQTALAVGPDGAPGRLGQDDDNNGTDDDATEIGWVNSDDFRTVMNNKDPAQATLMDLYRYRVWTEMRRKLMLQNRIKESDLAALSAAQYAQFLADVHFQASLVLGEWYNDANGNKIHDPSETTFVDIDGNLQYTPELEPPLFAREVIAGMRMDLDRPFGDGRDNGGDGLDNDGDGLIDEEDGSEAVNNTNGVVDDPLEAGDPFLDVNGNGRGDIGEPFIDIDGSGGYSPPRDQLWPGLTAEPIVFDYTNGHAEPLHPEVSALLGTPVLGGVRNLDSQARQLYARHLYCLMLLLVDENYIAPSDENDPQIIEYFDASIPNSISSKVFSVVGDAQETRHILLRKLTCRAIAQWAVNCVDARDADAIMTTFEYDENPWDGWGCQDANGVNIPLDGDAATNENVGQVIDWAEVSGPDNVKLVAPGKRPDGSDNPAIITSPPTPLNQTRGLVVGAERPDLIMTETVATHDRRTEDLASDVTKAQINNPTDMPDDDLDQRLRPKGSFFVEILNAWSPTGQYPAELYSRLTRPNNGDPAAPVGLQPSDGIELGRLSTMGVDNASGKLSNRIFALDVNKPDVRRSPVWRLIVVEEHPQYRNDDVVDNDNVSSILTGPLHARYKRTGTGRFFKAANPDWPTFDQQQAVNFKEPYVERSIYFTTDFSDRWGKREALPPAINTTDGSNSLALIPKTKRDPVTMRWAPDDYDKLLLPPLPRDSTGQIRGANYFIAGDARRVYDSLPNNEDIDVAIAPVKPGRYAVIGTAGAQYWEGTTTSTLPGIVQGIGPNGPLTFDKVPRYVTAISRMFSIKEDADPDINHATGIPTTRRIELRPHVNPDVQQVLVAGNGGTPLFPLPGQGGNDPIQRDNELIKLPRGVPNNNQQFFNIFDGDNDNNTQNGYMPDNHPDTIFIPACVAVPVAHMSVSEPIDLYKARRDVLDAEEKALGLPDLPSHYWDPLVANGEGMFVQQPDGSGNSPSPYDTPFDEAPELKRNGTTRNYRTIHLQRLADPTLPWNPLPTLPNGNPNAKHNPKLPVNLYRTIDTASADLTAYNGTSIREIDSPGVETEAKWLPRHPQTDMEFRNKYGVNGRAAPGHRLSFRSLERGLHGVDKTTAGDFELAPRSLWRQEPVTEFDLSDDAVNAKKNTMLEYKMTPNLSDRRIWLQKRFNDLRIRDVGNTGLKGSLLYDLDAISEPGGLDPEFQQFPPSLKPKESHFDLVLKHSLGFQNESFGALYMGGEAAPATSARGTPRPDREFAQSTVTQATLPPNGANPDIQSTYPWFAWNNRPFVSAEELLNVPAMSSSQMLGHYSTVFRTKYNPYDGTGIDPTNGLPMSVAVRLASYLSPFGHLLGAFQTASTPAGIARDPMGAPLLDANNNWTFIGAPHYYRILEFVHVPSRYVGTETMLTAETFNDVPAYTLATEVGTDITNPLDPRLKFQPPFNRVSRERDPGQVNLNTVTGRREVVSDIPRIWSEVFDGIMHRDRDMNPTTTNASHLGPSFRDVVLSRKGYAQVDAGTSMGPTGIGSVEKPTADGPPDVLMFGLNSFYPSVFSNPFRSPDAGDLVPLQHMMHFGIDVSWQRRHHFNRSGGNTWGKKDLDDDDLGDLRFETFNDTREAGFGGDDLVVDQVTQALLPLPSVGYLPGVSAQSGIPLLSESFTAPTIDGERNPYFYYQPMTRLSNLVTNRSNVFAVWITVGYFECEPAPNWNDPDDVRRQALRQRFGATNTGWDDNNDPLTIQALALYNRVYPDGYMIGREVGSDTGDVKRPRGFYIVDRTEEVGFKPGEDLNVEKMIRLKRRIE